MILLQRENKCPPNQCENGDPGKWTQLWKDGGKDNKWYIRHGAQLRSCNSKCHTPWASLTPPIIQDDSQEITSLLCCNNILRLVSQINDIGYCCKQHLLHYPTPLKSTAPFPVWSESQALSLPFAADTPCSEFLVLISSVLKSRPALPHSYWSFPSLQIWWDDLYLYIFFSNWCFCRVWFLFFIFIIIVNLPGLQFSHLLTETRGLVFTSFNTVGFGAQWRLKTQEDLQAT